MSTFIQLHILTSYPPSNLNRDDLGRPKTAIMGGVDRLRVSSQSLKRAFRTSEVFGNAVGDHIGVRTKRLGVDIKNTLVKKGVAEKKAVKWASKIAEQFGKLKKGDEALEIEQLAHIGVTEKKAVDDLLEKLVEENREPEADELKFLREEPHSVDIAMFGRMLASQPAFNMEAAVQVSHAVSIHRVTIEDDYFTAVDDLNRGEEDAGAGHIGEAGFAAGIFYIYLCINRDLLISNLSGDQELAGKSLKSLVEAAVKVSPSGKQNSFASRAYASCVLAEKGGQQPRSLSVAFAKPVDGSDILSDGIKQLISQQEKMERAYGKCCDASLLMDVEAGKGSLEEILNFVVE